MKLSKIQSTYESIKAKTGIDFEQHKEASWGERVADLVFFPQYALTAILKGPAVLVGLVLIIALVSGYFGHTSFAVFFGLIGLVLGIVNGFYLGCIWFIRTLTNDLNGLVDLTLEKSQSVVSSFKDPSQRAAYGASAIDVVQGVIFSMILPEVNRVVSKKVPVIGGAVAFVLGKVITKMGSSLETRLLKAAEEEHIRPDAEPEQQLALFSKIDNQSDKIASGAARVASFPFKVLLAVFGVISLGILGLIYWLLY